MYAIRPERIPVTLHRFDLLQGVIQELIPNEEHIIFEKVDDSVSRGFEGGCLRDYEILVDFKRGNNLLKAKKSDYSGTEIDLDVYVEDIEYGDFVIREDGKETIEFLPVALIVVRPDDQKCLQMKIGSGFSVKNRRDWSKDESLIVGKTIEARCQGFGANGRMRFPRYLRTREDL